MVIDLLANTITPAILSTTGYLFVLNAVIGAVEGALLQRWFRAGQRAIPLMILANYVSAWAGWWGTTVLVAPRLNALLGPRPIERVNLVTGGFFLATFLVSVVLEMAFVFAALGRERRTLMRMIRASFAVNAVTYPLIGAWFILVSYTLPLNAVICSERELGAVPRATLYWVDPDGRVLSRPLDAADVAPRVLGRVMLNDFVVPYQLRLVLDGDRVALEPKYSTIRYREHPTPEELEPPKGVVVVDAGGAIGLPADYWDQSPMLAKGVLDLRPVGKRQTGFKFDVFRQYLETDPPGRSSSRLIVGWGMLDWDMQQPTVLPDDKVVFEWAGQIVIFDPRTRRLAFVALGTCPAVVPAE